MCDQELCVEIRLSATGAQLKHEIVTAVATVAVNHDDITGDVIGGGIKLISSGRVIDDNVTLQQQQIRV